MVVIVNFSSAYKKVLKTRVKVFTYFHFMIEYLIEMQKRKTGVSMVETNLPILFLKDVVILPYNEARIEFSYEEKKVLTDGEIYHDGHILLINLIDPLEERPSIKDLPKFGIIGKIRNKIELSNGNVRVVITGIDRVEILNYIEREDNSLEAFVRPTKEYDYNETEATALKRMLIRNLESYVEVSAYMSNSVLGRINGVSSISKLSDVVVNDLPLSYQDKIKYIEMTNPMFRIRRIIEDLNKELETARIENELERALKYRMESEQKDYVLREKLNLIKEELGDNDLKGQDLQELRGRINELDAPSSIKKRLMEECRHYEMTPPTSPEVSIIRNYIDWLLNLPWNISTEDNSNIDDIKRSLDESHFGLDRVKKRILEFIAVREYTNSSNSPIICLVGPPGVGKTSLAKSIAQALHKKFIKISVGGVNDEAEIMGHRRTYIGASPGKIIQGMKKAGSNNPVFLIDEIDKITKDYRGDPASALLDVLDKEQNSIFTDNYIEEEYDLSKVMFILTANNKGMIPDALRDRLEIIELESYTLYEKKAICNNYLLPKQLDRHNIPKEKVQLTDSALEKLILSYTKEAGARELERQIASICRQIVISMLGDNSKLLYLIDTNDLEEYLGKEKYYQPGNEKNKESGVVNALAYTSNGGTILKVSSITFKGKGKLMLTGSLGDIMKESANIATSYIKSHYDELGINLSRFDDDIHIHFEEGAIPKDGPSAGVTIVTSLISTLKDIPVDNTVSMTGEITLRGKVLPIGGLKEKLIAAHLNGIRTVYIPEDNMRDLDEIPSVIQKHLHIIPVGNYKEIYDDLFSDLKDKHKIKAKKEKELEEKRKQDVIMKELEELIPSK